jgi:succinoglycan biosynthesis protein ExoA
VSETLPSVTVLIAARPGQAEVKAVIAGKQLDYPRERMEMIVARGKQPSVQRNAGIRAARGEIIYFLDDDSVPPPDTLRRAIQSFADPAVKMVGGPNLCPADAPFLEQIFALVHASWLAFAASRARYAKVGKLRASGEKELILCNLAARKQDLLDLGGFNELLYPNEENALMDALAKRGKLLYDPDMFIHRRPRRTLKSFVKMLLNYGRGRAEQFRVYPTIGSAPNFVPPLFVLYLVAIPLLWLAVGSLSLVPLLPYGVGLLAQAAVLVPQGGVVRSVCAIPFMVLTHVVYGLGFIRGLFTSLKPSADKPKAEVVLETVQL